MIERDRRYPDADALLRQATCAVLVGDQIAGTAWLVSQTELLTAGHLFAHEPLGRIQVLFEGHGEQPMPVTLGPTDRVYDRQSGLDFAILRFSRGEESVDRQPLPIALDYTPVERATYKVYGFGRLLATMSPGFATWVGPYIPGGSARAVESPEPGAGELYRLDSVELAEEGYSGGAVFSFSRRAVVAIQTEGDTATKEAPGGRVGAGRRTVLAVPLRWIAAVCPRLREIASETPPGGVDPTDSPYRGPKPYNESDEDLSLFFGRDKEAKAIVEEFTSKPTRVLAIYAPSGAGKTSLINTEVRHRLMTARFSVLVNVRVGGVCPLALEPGVGNVFTYGAVCSTRAYKEPGDYRAHFHDTLLDLVNRWVAESTSPVDGQVIFFDQFEEVFTRHTYRAQDRAKFFDQLRVILDRHPQLRVTLVIRKEFIYELRLALRDMSAGLAVEEVALERFGIEAAREAICSPAKERGVRYDDDAANALVKALATEKALAPDQQVVEVHGTIIEPVHLSIVCDRLWRTLEPKTQTITLNTIDRFRERRAPCDFVGSVLTAYYEAVVKEVGASDSAKEEGFSEQVIHCGVMQFVTPQGTRALVPRGDRRTGRLPNWIIDLLTDKYLLRADERGGQRWYELTHDRLIDPVQQQREKHPLLAMLWELTDVISPVLGKQESLTDYFEPHPEILAKTGKFYKSPVLSSEESELIFRSTLAALDDEQRDHWAARLMADFPFRFLRVIREALTLIRKVQDVQGVVKDTAIHIRLKAARLAGRFLLERKLAKARRRLEPSGIGGDNTAAVPRSIEDSLADFDEMVEASKLRLEDLAVSDDSRDVREAAAIALAQLDEPEHYDGWVHGLKAATAAGDRSKRGRYMEAIAHAANERSAANGDPKECAQVLRTCCRDLGPWIRFQVWLKMLRIRLGSGWVKFLYVMPLAAIGGAVFTAFIRWLPAIWYLTWTQIFPDSLGKHSISSGIGEGLFQAICGGVVWGLTISVAVALTWIVFQRGEPGRTRTRRIGTAFAGVLGGIAGGLILSLIVLSVYKPESLEASGWVSSFDGSARTALDGGVPEKVAVTYKTRGIWIYPVYGVYLGLGCAWAAMSMRSGKGKAQWDETVKKSKSDKNRQRLDVWAVFRHSVFSSWPLLLCMAGAAMILCLVLRPTLRPTGPVTGYVRNGSPVNPSTTNLKNFCDAATIVAGGVGIVFGMMYGVFIVRVGVQIHPQRD